MCLIGESLIPRGQQSESLTWRGSFQRKNSSGGPHVESRNQHAFQGDCMKDGEAEEVIAYLSSNGASVSGSSDKNETDEGWSVLASESINFTDSEADWESAQHFRDSAKRSPYEGPGSFSCVNCGKVYKWRRTLQNHLRVECGKEPGFQCPFCSLKSKRKGNVTAHIKAVHGESVNPFVL